MIFNLEPTCPDGFYSHFSASNGTACFSVSEGIRKKLKFYTK